MTAAVRNSQRCWLPIIAYGEDTHASATKPDARLFRKPDAGQNTLLPTQRRTHNFAGSGLLAS